MKPVLSVSMWPLRLFTFFNWSYHEVDIPHGTVYAGKPCLLLLHIQAQSSVKLVFNVTWRTPWPPHTIQQWWERFYTEHWKSARDLENYMIYAYFVMACITKVTLDVMKPLEFGGSTEKVSSVILHWFVRDHFKMTWLDCSVQFKLEIQMVNDSNNIKIISNFFINSLLFDDNKLKLMLNMKILEPTNTSVKHQTLKQK